jgi:acyl-CoA thioester hydrolase
MPRVKIIEPSKYVHQFTISVRVTDLNYGNHLANERVLTYAQEARVDFLSSCGKSELDFWGTSLIQGDAAVFYQNEGFLANVISIDLGFDDVTSSSFDIVYKMTNVSTGKPLALVKTRMVCFDYDHRKVTSVPTDFKSLVL